MSPKQYVTLKISIKEILNAFKESNVSSHSGFS